MRADRCNAVLMRLAIVAGCSLFPVHPRAAQAQALPSQGLTAVAPGGSRSTPSPNASAPDFSGGAFIAWADRRRGDESDIYLQHVGPAGQPLWAAEGVPVCVAGGDQTEPVVIAESDGGALVVWFDLRAGSGYGDIYAQRFSSGGIAQWATDGVLLGGGAANYGLAAVSDGTDGAIAVWTDVLLVYGRTRAQHITAAGQAAWAPGGVQIAPSTENQNDASVIADGAGGIIVAWTESNDIRAQRVAANAQPRWGASGVLVCGAVDQQDFARLASDGARGAIIAWSDYRSQLDFDVFAQRIDSTGAARWAANGINVVTTPEFQGDAHLVPDGAGGALVAWKDGRAGTSVYGQRLNAAGVPQWTANGVVLGDNVEGEVLSCVPDLANGALLAWTAVGNGRDIRAQHVSASGTVAWGTGGFVVCAMRDDQYTPAIVPDGTGAAVVSWLDHRSRVDEDLYAQRVTPAGAAMWTVDGVPVHLEPGVQKQPAITGIGNGAFAIAWSEKHGTDYDIRARALDSAGLALFPSAAISGAQPDLQEMPSIAADGSGGAIVAWTDWRAGTESDVYAQHVDASGATKWAAGVPVCTTSGNQGPVAVLADPAHGAYLAWVDKRTVGEADVYAQRLDASGVARWGSQGMRVTLDGNPVTRLDVPVLTLVPDATGGVYVVWAELLNGNQWVRIQRYDSSGTAQWTNGGVRPVTTLSGNGAMWQVSAAPDGAGGLVLAWHVGTFMGPTLPWIYAQQMNTAGNLLWGAAGVPIVTSPKVREHPVIVATDDGGAIVGWRERNVDYDVYAQRVRTNGTTAWTTDGILVRTAAGEASVPTMESDGSGGAILAWSDGRNVGGPASYDLYAQRVDSSGVGAWGANGTAIVTAVGRQERPVSLAAADGVLLAWADWRGGDGSLLFAQHLSGNGTLLWPSDGVTSTLASLVESSVTSARVRLVWQVDRSMLPVQVLRSASGAAWTEIAVKPPTDGRVIVDDRDVRPGARYEYRLVLPGSSLVLDQTWIDVPMPNALALQVAGANPSRVSAVRVAFTLVDASPAQLMVYDIQGRRLMAREIGSFGPGRHDLELRAPTPFPAGVYVIRLAQGAATVEARAVVLH